MPGLTLIKLLFIFAIFDIATGRIIVDLVGDIQVSSTV